MQQDRATSHPLPHVRHLAAKAAIAWRNEGIWAEKREQRHRTLVLDESEPTDDFSGPDPDEYVPRARR
ncbi:hypothetical protein [Sphingobium aromaticiconvertens]|uniref:hypothetical protein n=1 Tax=Sphingobium aromaticiconvertens TaxID=365341 RepID=UPI0030191B89